MPPTNSDEWPPPPPPPLPTSELPLLLLPPPPGNLPPPLPPSSSPPTLSQVPPAPQQYPKSNYLTLPPPPPIIPTTTALRENVTKLDLTVAPGKAAAPTSLNRPKKRFSIISPPEDAQQHQSVVVSSMLSAHKRSSHHRHNKPTKLRMKGRKPRKIDTTANLKSQKDLLHPKLSHSNSIDSPIPVTAITASSAMMEQTSILSKLGQIANMLTRADNADTADADSTDTTETAIPVSRRREAATVSCSHTISHTIQQPQQQFSSSLLMSSPAKILQASIHGVGDIISRAPAMLPTTRNMFLPMLPIFSAQDTTSFVRTTVSLQHVLQPLLDGANFNIAVNDSCFFCLSCDLQHIDWTLDTNRHGRILVTHLIHIEWTDVGLVLHIQNTRNAFVTLMTKNENQKITWCRGLLCLMEFPSPEENR